MAKHRSWFSPRVQHGLAKPSRGQARRNGRNLTLPLSELVFVLGSPRARAAPTSLCHTGPAPRDGGTGSVALELGLWPGSDACERRARALFWGPGVKDRFGFSAKHPMQGHGSPVGNGARSRGLCATVFALPSCLGLEMQSSWGQQRERRGDRVHVCTSAQVTSTTAALGGKDSDPRPRMRPTQEPHIPPAPKRGHTLDVPAPPHASAMGASPTARGYGAAACKQEHAGMLQQLLPVWVEDALWPGAARLFPALPRKKKKSPQNAGCSCSEEEAADKSEAGACTEASQR